jgi:hypothetical protein
MPKRGSCGSVLPGCRLSKQYPSINSPAARCCTSRARRDAHCTLLGFPVGRDPRRLVLAPRLPSRAAPTCDPHSARCSAGCHTSRDFVPWRFLDAGQLSARVFHCCRRPKTSTNSDIRVLIDHLIGAPQNRNWKRQSQFPRGPEIHHQFNFRGLLDRQVGGIFTIQNSSDVNTREPI